MSLLSLPAELRLRIYDFLPELKQDRIETLTAYSAHLTPSICRTSTLLRRETLPIFASNSLFSFPMDDAPELWARRVECWIQAMGSDAISRVRSFQFSQHWKITQPMRWMRHVGFYLRIERPKIKVARRLEQPHGFNTAWSQHFVEPSTESDWQVTTGTYPMARDARGMRLQSVELLAQTVQARFRATSLHSHIEGLSTDDVRFLLRAVNVVAAHAISYYDSEAGDDGDRKPREIWSNMKSDLELLAGAA